MKDVLQYKETVVKTKLDIKDIALIILGIIVITEAIIIGVLVLKPSTEEKYDTMASTEITELTTEALPVPTEQEVSTEITTMDTSETTEEIVTEAPVTEAPVTEAPVIDDYTTRDYYPLFTGYSERYNTYSLVDAINYAYLPELRDVILTQTLQSVNAQDEPSYWETLKSQYGGEFTSVYTVTEETILGEDTVNSLVAQLSQYGYMGTIEQAVSVRATQTITLKDQDHPCLEKYNRFVVIKTDTGAWWIVGKQAE